MPVDPEAAAVAVAAIRAYTTHAATDQGAASWINALAPYASAHYLAQLHAQFDGIDEEAGMDSRVTIMPATPDGLWDQTPTKVTYTAQYLESDRLPGQEWSTPVSPLTLSVHLIRASTRDPWKVAGIVEPGGGEGA